MKFTFKSEQYGTVVEMSFEGVTLSEIEEMYKQFLRGSGFYLVEDKDDMSTKQESSDTYEECVHESDNSTEHPLDIYERAYFAGKQDGIAEALAQPEQEPVDIHCPSCLHSFSIVPVAKREWVSLTDEEIAYAVGSPIDEVYLADFRKVEAKLKEKNNG